MSRPVVVLMGVSGAGKSTVGARLAELLATSFHEGDVFHPPANVAKMSGGTPLDDGDRLPWLAAIAQAIDAARQRGDGMVIACSALKRAYREILIGPRADVRLAYLRGTRDLIQARLDARQNHFMPAALLPSQFAALEEPAPAENAIVVGIDGTPEAIAQAIAARLR